MTYFRRSLLIAVILFSCVGCDQATKIIAKNHLLQARPTSYLGDTFRLQYRENKGAFLSLGSTLPAEVRFWVLFVLTGIAVTGMLVFVLMNRKLRCSFRSAPNFAPQLPEGQRAIEQAVKFIRNRLN